MPKLRYLSFLFILFAFLGAEAQNSSQSPFSRFGYGNLESLGAASQRTLGGTGLALSGAHQINLLNPTFSTKLFTPIFNINGSGSFTTISGNDFEYKQSFSNMNSVAFAFPVVNGFGFQFGLRPYSAVNYSLDTQVQVDSTNINANYSGSGGLRNAYLAVAYELINQADSNVLTVAAQFNHYFGPLSQERTLFTDALNNGYGVLDRRSAILQGSAPEFFVNYSFYPNKDKGLKVNLAANFRPEVNLKGEQEIFSFTFLRNFGGTPVGKDTIQYAQSANNNSNIPSKYGFGIGLEVKDKLILGVDYTQQAWSNFSQNFSGDELDGVFTDYTRISAGVQFTPSRNILFNEPIWNFISYSAGIWSSKGYIDYNGATVEEFGTSFGLRIPFRKSRSNSALQIGYEYAVRGNVAQNLIQEKRSQIIFGLSLSPNFIDRWFYKRKYD